jgi:serine/threonine protein kinase
MQRVAGTGDDPPTLADDDDDRRGILPEGTEVGPYRLLQVLGRGGMGIVYLAEQHAPLQRQVALKVIRPGLDSREIVRRFESERQALALMNHPHIARVLDGGSTADGRPYFAMEYVPGVAITDFCDLRTLDTRQRLELFVEVCQAVQHAHQKGLIHRDLKPSNILVATQDGSPVPKVIDFGVAKATAGRPEDATSFTRLGEMIGTPEYMSPEQAEGSLDVDSTSDIYSLGAILYELLVGAQPFDAATLRGASFAELQRILKDSDPARPSLRLRTMAGAEATTVAARRSTDVATLRAQLRGDLDWITLKAMEKDRTRRYASASELAADVLRYLREEPISARPPSTRYRVQKFVRRHRAAVAAAVLIGLALVFGITAATAGLLRARRAEAEARLARKAAERETERAKAVNDFLRDVLGAADPRQQGRDVKVVEALQKALGRLNATHDMRPELEAAVRDTIGNTFLSLGDLPAAEEQVRAGLETRRRVLGPDDPETLTSMSSLMAVLQTAGKVPEALTVGRDVLARRRRVLGPEHPDTTVTLNDLAVTLCQAGQDEECEQLLRLAADIRRRVLGPEDPRTLVAESNLASVLENRDKLAEAEPLMRQVLEVQRRKLGGTHSNTIYTIKSLAGLLHDRKKLEEAEALYREALEASRRTSGPQHLDTLVAANDFAVLLVDRDKLGEAEALLRSAIAGAEASLPKGHRFTASFRRNLGRCLTKAGRYPEAEGELLAAFAMFKTQGAERDVQGVARRLVTLYEAWGRPARAEPYRALVPKPPPA